MAAPVLADLMAYPGSYGTPVDDVTPYGGAINVSTPIDPAVLNSLLFKIFLPSIDTIYYDAFYFQNNCTTPGTLASARIYNRAGARVNTSAGSCQYVSTLATDTGIVRTTGKVGGVFTQEDVTLTGTTPISGSKSWDISSVVRHEYLTLGLASTQPTGQVSISVAGQIIAVIYGTTLGYATSFSSVEFKITLATTKGSTVSGTNRLTAPNVGTLGAFSTATYWSGDDNSLGVPGGFLAFGESIAVVTQFTSFAGIFIPVGNTLKQTPTITGIPQ